MAGQPGGAVAQVHFNMVLEAAGEGDIERLTVFAEIDPALVNMRGGSAHKSVPCIEKGFITCGYLPGWWGLECC